MSGSHRLTSHTAGKGAEIIWYQFCFLTCLVAMRRGVCWSSSVLGPAWSQKAITKIINMTNLIQYMYEMFLCDCFAVWAHGSPEHRFPLNGMDVFVCERERDSLSQFSSLLHLQICCKGIRTLSFHDDNTLAETTPTFFLANHTIVVGFHVNRAVPRCVGNNVLILHPVKEQSPLFLQRMDPPWMFRFLQIFRTKHASIHANWRILHTWHVLIFK